ncbi:hypothetical protein OAT67_06220 [Bacteriovoracaceae bacterium]|nr:hypothetical protein [Bacteriovoracaceae bacterium]
MSLINRISEISKDPTLRKWFVHKIFNPTDKGMTSKKGTPPYLEVLLLDNDWKNIPVNVMLPQCSPLESLEDASTFNLRLASDHFDICFESFKDENFFSKYSGMIINKPDAEDREAFFRLSFILHSIEKNNGYSNIEKKIVLDWAKTKINTRDSHYSYTIAERISNIGIFLSRSQLLSSLELENKNTLLKKILEDVEHLINNLEYFGEDLTSNHLGNNGRGILWASLILRNDFLLKIGKKILRKEFDRIVQNEGIIREGSSHYQKLICRNYLEACWILSSTNDESKNDFFQMSEKLLKGSSFLTLQGRDPLVGDISPDFSPEWFMGIVNKEVHTGWVSHFDFQLPHSDQQFEGFSKMDDFIRIDEYDFSILVHMNKGGMPNLPGHSHCDSSSPVIVFRGEELLIDLGRKNYKPESNDYITSTFHNMLKIDSQEQEVSPRGIFGKKFRKKVTSGGTVLKSNGKRKIEIKNFRSKGVNVLFEIKLTKDSIALVYELQPFKKNKKTALVELPLYLANENFSVNNSEGEMFKIEEHVRSVRYGQESKCFKYFFQKEVILPTKLSFEISKIGN